MKDSQDTVKRLLYFSVINYRIYSYNCLYTNKFIFVFIILLKYTMKIYNHKNFEKPRLYLNCTPFIIYNFGSGCSTKPERGKYRISKFFEYQTPVGLKEYPNFILLRIRSMFRRKKEEKYLYIPQCSSERRIHNLFEEVIINVNKKF